MESHLNPEQDALEHIVAWRDKPFLKERFIDPYKGRGVFTNKAIEPSTFVVEYRGNIFSQNDTRPENRHGDSLNGFLYRFSWNGAQWCVDASKEDRSLGRLVNDDDISPNCEMRKIDCQGKPHLCLFAVKKISPGDEITFNYGDFSYPWRSRETWDGASTSNTDSYPTSSTPRNKRVEDSAASGSDNDNELPGPSNDNHSSANIDSHASSTERDHESSLSSDDSDEDYEPPESPPSEKAAPFTRRNYCYVCRKGYYKISRHLVKHVDDEPEIAEAFALPVKSPERARLLNILRNRGNYEHNQEVLRNKTGELKLMRRPKANAEISALTTQQEHESALTSDEHDSDGDYEPSESEPDNKDTSFTTKNYCYVCGVGVRKITRHFLTHLDDEPEIAKACSLPFNSPERNRLLNILRNRGNYEHNQEVLRNNSGELKLKRRPKAKLGISASSTQREQESALSSDEHDSDGDHESEPQDQDTTFTSKNFCYVCKKGVHKIARHFLTHIDDEPEIAKACSLPFNSPERSRLLSKLRNRGNYKHNQEVMKNNSGELKLKKRPNAKTGSVQSYVYCLYCKGMFKRVELWRHVPKCAQKMSATRGKTGVLNEDSLESQCPQKSSGVWKMLLSMKQDDTAFVVQNDKLLMQLAQSLYEKHPANQGSSIQKLRELGRLLLALYEKLIFNFEDALKLKNFNNVVEAVKKMACFDRKNKSYRKPNLALRLGHLLKRLGNVVINGAESSAKTVRDAEKFIELCDKEWTELSGQKVNAPSTIPFTRDVQAFYRCLEKESAFATESLKMNETPQVYKTLCRVTLAQASVLNKCPLEVAKMTLKSFQDRGDTTRVLSKHFLKINIPRKTGQNVAVLLTSQLVAALTLLVSKRLACGVHKDNPFLFAKPNSSSTSLYNGGNCVRDFSSLCCAKNPEHLRSLNLHKHMARIFQILNLENDELDHLAKLLGHDIRTDRDYYRLPEAAVELARIAKLLVAMEKGSLEKFKGNSLEEIEIEDELEPESEKVNPENTDAEEDAEESDPLQQIGDVEQRGRRLTPERDALEHITARRDKAFLEERLINSLKGKGVFTRKSIEPSTFVVEYRGNILTHKEMQKQKRGDTLNKYMFDFRWKETNWRIDASTEDGGLGRLVNEDDTNPNCEMKKIVYKGKPHLCLFALKKISPDEEITCNYKDSRVEDLAEASSSAESDSDEDYVCDDQPNSDDSVPSDNDQNDVKASASSNQQENKSDHSSESDSDSDKESTKGRSFTKKNYCYVCGKAQSKISRHLLTHRDEHPDIAEVLALRRNSKERKSLLQKLRNRGNYKHNQEVLKNRSGELKVQRTSEMLKTFATCIYCKGMYGRKVVWRHMQKCPSKRFSNPPAGGRTQILTLIAATGLTDPDQLSPGVRNMLKKLKKDEVASVVWEDPYILQLAQCLYYINEEKQRDTYINQSLRHMARLLMTLRKKSICSFEEAIKPHNFSSVVEAVRELAGFKEETKACDKPSVMWKTGYLLKKIADIKYGRALKDEADQETVQTAETFMKLCAKEWPTNSPATLKIVRPPTILFTQDVQLLYQCMVKTVDSAVQTLSLYQSAPVYSALLRPTLAYVTILNKNMKELSKVTLKSFQERDEVQPQENAAASQSQFEEIWSKLTVKINVVSNSGKKMILTLTHELLSAITLLVSKREKCGVHKKNPFLFARPVAICTSFCQGQQSINTFVSRCDAKNQESLRSVFFRKHILQIFQILCLTNDELDQLAKVLGREIRTEAEYYQTPEAAADIARISMLLTAMESGCLNVFEGKSLEEIEIPDGVEPFVEPETPENSDAGEDDEGSETGRPAAKKKSRFFSSKKGRRGRKKKRDKENEQTELNNEENNNAETEDKSEDRENEQTELNKEENNNAETEDKSEDVPVTCAVSTPEETRSEINKTDIYFSDDDDVNENFDMDVDLDTDNEVRNEDSDGDSNLTAERKDTSSNQHLGDGDREEKESEKEDDEAEVEAEDDGDEALDDGDATEDDWMDVDTNYSSSTSNTEKKNNLSAMLSRMKELKILVPKLDIEKVQTPVHVSQLSSLNITWPVKDQLISDDKDRSETPPAEPTEPTEPAEPEEPAEPTEPAEPANKSVNMICSHCKKTMMKGHTAYQKKGFSDVFCSKSCLFQMFLHNKPPAKTCHYCLKAISQPQDLIMAAVDSKGTMKDFCSVACLCSFKSPNAVSIQTPKPLCSMCNKSCTTTFDLTLEETVRTFCSDGCLDGFCRDNVGVCENCSAACRREPLVLKLEDATKTLCGEKCLDKFKEKITTTHQCTMCYVSRPVLDMVYYKTLEGTVELFCGRACMFSHKLRPTYVPDLQGKKTTKAASNPAANTNKSSTAAEPVTIETQLGDSYITCCKCGKMVQRGQMLYQPENALELYCSASCFSQSHPNVKLGTRKCHNCFQVITRPQNIIRAPVDDSGTLKELCSNTCLSSVKAKIKVTYPRPDPQFGSCTVCKMCSKSSFCKFKLPLDGVVHRLCSESCGSRYYHKVKKQPIPRCDICSTICPERQLMLKMEDGSKTVCSDECLVKFKEKVETRQLCPTCQTSHWMSDMVENRNKEGTLDFFCSSRCMLVSTGPSFTVSETKSPSPNEMKGETDSKELKPLLPKLKCIKEEPIDEAYSQNPSASMFPEDIKHEVNVVKVKHAEEEEEEEEEDLKVCSVFSLTGDSTSTETAVTNTGMPASCTGCRKDLMDKETVYQRKDHTDMFCSTSCLFKFHQAKTSTCSFCLRVITEPQNALKSAVDVGDTKKVFCSQLCMSSFTYKEVAATKMPIVLLSSHSQCSMCSRYCISKREIIQQGVVHKICSDQCFLRFCNLNNLSICENCRSHCNKPLTVKTEDGHKTLCSAECLNQFKQKILSPQPCAMCRTSKPMSDMVENKNSDDVVELFCTSSCAMASKVQTASGAPLNCDNCDKMSVPACHLAMSDATIGNFCSLTCAMAFKDNKKDVNTGTNGAGASDQTQSDIHKPPEKLLCAQCKCVIKVTPKVIRDKDKIVFVCSLTCSQEFKIINNIVGICEHCKNEKLIRDIKRIDDKDCQFCSEGCKMLHRHELEKKWGKPCRPCAYCFSISRIVVTTRDQRTDKEFCSEVCCMNYKKLVSREAKCDACGLKGELKKSLSVLGSVQNFCDLTCLLHFCSKQVQMVEEAGSCPVIVNVVSLAGALAERLRSMNAAAQLRKKEESRKKESDADVKTKVAEQKVTKELKNKSVLCTPLVHNKGVSCAIQTVETEKQTECRRRINPKVVILPVPLPVPVYVPVPMNMYSQYTPKPMGLPLPLPVPVFLSEKSVDSGPTMTDLEERMREDGQKDERVTKDGEAQETQSLKISDVDLPTTPLPENVASPLSQQAEGKLHNKNKLQQLPKTSEKETCQRSVSQDLMSKMPHKLETQCGIDAWRSWIQWRESQTNMGRVSSHAVTLKEDVLSCSTAELSSGLCRFIHEVKRPDGEPYSPGGLFYLCLSIQQYLFDNGRFENIFSDLVYSRFSAEFTNILKHFKPPVTPSGYIHFHVEEEFLWDCKQLGAYSPIVLLNTLLFFCCKYFGFTTVEQHRQLSFAHLKLCTRANQNNSETTFLRFYPPTSLNETNSDADGVPAKRRKRNEGEENFLEMMENTENPLRCPVRLYEFYLSKCPDSVRQRSDLFYLRPDPRCVPGSPLWFSPTPLDASSMEAMIVRILVVRELQRMEEDGRDACTDKDAE